MSCSSLLRMACALTLAITALVSSTHHHGGPTAWANDPCDAVANDPNPPVGPPVPDIGGTVLNSSAASPIQGATITLLRCVAGDPIYVAQTTTNSQGDFLFSGIADETWYILEASMTGSLAGKSPTGNTVNPTVPIGLGNSVTNVLLTFQ